jgi:hypothetical protein
MERTGLLPSLTKGPGTKSRMSHSWKLILQGRDCRGGSGVARMPATASAQPGGETQWASP